MSKANFVALLIFAGFLALFVGCFIHSMHEVTCCDSAQNFDLGTPTPGLGDGDGEPRSAFRDDYEGANDTQVQRAHEPDDVLANGQQDQFKDRPAHIADSIVVQTVGECRSADGVPYWLYTRNGEQYLTCHAGNVVGVTMP